MHALFVHPNYPAQFGHLARALVRRGHRATCVTERPPVTDAGVERVRYAPAGGATARTHFFARGFENAVAHADGVYRALKARPDVQPDLVVGHSGFGSTLFLKELYPGVPVVNLFEYFYRATGSDIDFRPDFPGTEATRLRAKARNAMIFLDLDNCDLGYCPTEWQRSRFPAEYRPKLRVVHDGIDTGLWKPRPPADRVIAGRAIPDGVKVVTYATRGMESMRGFDIFMRMAKRLADRRPDVLFVVAGQDRQAYGGDDEVTGSKSFKEWVLSKDAYDLERFRFVGFLTPPELAKLFNLTDLHVYLTVPFVLSWSLLNALACGATVLASDTAPVREVIAHDVNGLLCDFFDADGMADAAGRVLDAPADYRRLGAAGSDLVRRKYSMEVCLPQMLQMYEEALGRKPAAARGPAKLGPPVDLSRRDRRG